MRSYNFYKWRIWSILALSFVMSLFHRGALGVISEDLTRTLGLTASQISNVASVTFYAYAFMQIPAGLLLDYFGYRRISYYGVFITGLGSIIIGSSINIYFAYTGRLLVGLGTSVIFISILKAQRIWFSEKEFTKASGRLSFIGNMGGIIATFPLAFLVKGLGWRSSLILMGALCILIAILIYTYVKNSPMEYGYEPRGVIAINEKIKVWDAIKEVAKNSATWRNFFVLFTLVGCTTALTGLWGVSYITSVYGITKGTASFYIAFIVYGLVAGSVFVAKAEKVFKDNIILYPRISGVIIASCWGFILFICKGKPSLSVLGALFFVMGFFAMSHILAFTDINKSCDVKNGGLASSLVNSGEFIGSSIISLIIGFFLDLNWDGQVIEGVRYYSPELFVRSFYIFFIISLIGVITSFIGNKKELNVGNNKFIA
jgi:MFS family permease